MEKRSSNYNTSKILKLINNTNGQCYHNCTIDELNGKWNSIKPLYNNWRAKTERAATPNNFNLYKLRDWWSLLWSCCRSSIISYDYLIADAWNGVNLVREEITSMNQILRLTKSTTKDTTEGEYIYYANIDLHTTRNLYLHSSGLGSYDTLSNFDIDTIVLLFKGLSQIIMS